VPVVGECERDRDCHSHGVVPLSSTSPLLQSHNCPSPPPPPSSASTAASGGGGLQAATAVAGRLNLNLNLNAGSGESSFKLYRGVAEFIEEGTSEVPVLLKHPGGPLPRCAHFGNA
jgi:hypothetical protein